MRRALYQPELVDTTSSTDPDKFLLSTFPGEDVMKKASAQRFSKSFFNTDVHSIEKPDKNRGLRGIRQEIDG